MRPLALVAALSLLAFAGSLRADDEEPSAAAKLELVSKAEKGAKERLSYTTKIERTSKDDVKAHQSLSIEVVRKIKSVGEDGLSEKESLTFEKGKMDFDDGQNGQQTQTIPGPMAFPIERASKSRRAIVEDGAPEIPDGLAPQLMAVYRRDPDGLARVLAPKDAVKVGDTWKPDLAALLLFLGPKKAKLVEEGSKAEATLESVRTKGEHPIAQITLQATLVYTLPDDPEAQIKTKIEATITGPSDGSGSPSREEVTARTKNADGSKETITVEIDRKKVRAKADADKGDGSSDK